MTSERMHELFNQTLLGEYEDDAPWDAVSELRSNGSREVFEIAAQWLQEGEPLKRARGGDSCSTERAIRKPHNRTEVAIS